MATENCVPAGVLGLCRSPWPSMAAAVGVALLSALILPVFKIYLVFLPFIALIAAGIGVAISPRSPLVLLSAAGCAVLAWNGLPGEWDSLRMVVLVMAAVAVVAAGIVVLPPVPRRIVASLLLLIHFGGIGCAILNVNPAPWLTQYLWAHFYRYYLDFVYLNNAYHFYAPEPGPGVMLWFYVKYDDGTAQWVKIPDRDSVPTLLNYQRRLSIPEQANQFAPLPGIPQEVLIRRIYAGNADGIPVYDFKQANPVEYRPPLPYAQRVLESYARHVCKFSPHPSDPARRVVSVKVYRVIHRLINAREVVAGVDPHKEWFFMPYYQGEYDTEGKLLSRMDPYLWWLIPIVNQSNPDLSSGVGVDADNHAAAHQDKDILNCLQTHVKLKTLRPVPNGGQAPVQAPGQALPPNIP